jgi:hypothetical protein
MRTHKSGIGSIPFSGLITDQSRAIRLNLFLQVGTRKGRKDTKLIGSHRREKKVRTAAAAAVDDRMVLSLCYCPPLT